MKKMRDAATYQKLLPPKSLQGDEDAEVTWEMIMKRYPNAAPLLCEMETVIDRAESLLQQLRSPYTQGLERSSSFQIADSEDDVGGPYTAEESVEVSMTSRRDSITVYDDNYASDNVSIEAGFTGGRESESVQVRFPNVSSHEPSVASSANCMEYAASKEPEVTIHEEHAVPEERSSLAHVEDVPGEPRSILYEDYADESATVLMPHEMNGIRALSPIAVGKASSLEGWARVVGEQQVQSMYKRSGSMPPISPISIVEDEVRELAARMSTPLSPRHSFKEDSVSSQAKKLTSLTCGPMQQITKLRLLGKKDELTQRFAGTITTASNVLDVTRTIIQQEEAEEEVEEVNVYTEDADDIIIVTERNERGEKQAATRTSQPKCHDVGKVSFSIPISQRLPGDELGEKKDPEKTVHGKIEDDIQGSGDEGSLTDTGKRMPIDILQEYGKKCNVSVEYNNEQTISPANFNKKYVIKCCFAGFVVTACAKSRRAAKNESAMRMLRLLAGRQIDGESLLGLPTFSMKQMEEIINLGTGGEPETAVRKLYKLCLEKRAPEPVYNVQQDNGIMGHRFTVKCEALGYTTSGFGIRAIVAKRVAADELLRMYSTDQTVTY